jgi:hypothetical protein
VGEETMFEEIRKILCCYFLAHSGATIYRFGIWFMLGDLTETVSWVVSLAFDMIMLHAFFKNECKDILMTLKNRRK